MRKIEIIEEEILVVKQALCDYLEKLTDSRERYTRNDIETIEKVLKKIKEELNKQL